MAEKKLSSLNDVSAKEAKAKDAALESTVSGIRKEFGEGSLMRLGDKGTVKVEAIPTGALALDLALGIVVVLDHDRVNLRIDPCRAGDGLVE